MRSLLGLATAVVFLVPADGIADPKQRTHDGFVASTEWSVTKGKTTNFNVIYAARDRRKDGSYRDWLLVYRHWCKPQGGENVCVRKHRTKRLGPGAFEIDLTLSEATIKTRALGKRLELRFSATGPPDASSSRAGYWGPPLGLPGPMSWPSAYAVSWIARDAEVAGQVFGGTAPLSPDFAVLWRTTTAEAWYTG